MTPWRLAAAPTRAGPVRHPPPPALTTSLPFLPGVWLQVWGVAVALYLVGTVVWNLFATGERVFD